MQKNLVLRNHLSDFEIISQESGFDFSRRPDCPIWAVIATDKNFAKNFEKGHPRNVPIKIFQNLTSGFGEKSFLRISSYLYSAKSPHSPEPYL